jgi:hypothetical protein
MTFLYPRISPSWLVRFIVYILGYSDIVVIFHFIQISQIYPQLIDAQKVQMDSIA